jgi:hypothetical protein
MTENPKRRTEHLLLRLVTDHPHITTTELKALARTTIKTEWGLDKPPWGIDGALKDLRRNGRIQQIPDNRRSRYLVRWVIGETTELDAITTRRVIRSSTFTTKATP